MTKENQISNLKKNGIYQNEYRANKKNNTYVKHTNYRNRFCVECRKRLHNEKVFYKVVEYTKNKNKKQDSQKLVCLYCKNSKHVIE